ncbi:MAG: 50S ribosomal protein L18 [Planctomycetaceae bacterium]|jgi:large subunit ribosomal protein L18|nr:50S ribosomal protein L18 [Planctomycetaceae bacterium]
MVSNIKRQQLRRKRRVNRVRNAIRRCSTRQYRLSVFRSNSNIYAQLIDDEKGVTVCAANTLQNNPSTGNGGSVAAATEVGTRIAELAAALNIKEAALDRGAYRYHGRIAALADAARAAGLNL